MDRIFVNGNIYTMAGIRAEALAIHGGRIVWAGSAQGALALKTADTKVTDLGGRCVLPGFCDSHMHMLLSGVGFHRLDLRGVRSPEELAERGRTYIKTRGIAPGEWVIGYGFDHNLFADPKLPDGRVAEAISEVHPVLLDRVCGHVGTANPLAFQKAGYTPDTVLPGGELDRDGTGVLTGILRETAMAEDPKPLHHRIVHCQIGSEELYSRMAALGMGADVQPPFTVTDAPHVAPRLGEARARESYAWRTLLNRGILVGGGSDSPVEDYAPLWGIYCAVTRSDGQGGLAWRPEQRLSVEEALRLYTKNGAMLAHQEGELGTLEVGKLADLVVLDRDLFEINPEEIKDAQVLFTMMGGRETFRDASVTF